MSFTPEYRAPRDGVVDPTATPDLTEVVPVADGPLITEVVFAGMPTAGIAAADTDAGAAPDAEALFAPGSAPAGVAPEAAASTRREQRSGFLGRRRAAVAGPAPTLALPAELQGFTPAYSGQTETVAASAAPLVAEDSRPRFRPGSLLAQTPTPSALDAKSISAWFGDHQVLHDVSLTMPAGRVTALIGPSGCGKSTFLRILNRMHELVPSASLAGEVLLDGDDIYDASHRLIDARKNIGMVFQKPNPFPAMSIYDNVIAGLRLTGMRAGRDEKDYLVERSLTSAGLWKEVKDRLRAPGGGLSGGQQQRLCIARSLAIKPKVLLMDEPCSALDPTSTRVIEDTMGELAKEVTIVIVTHNMQQAQRVSQQCAFFLASQGQPGHIVEHGDTEAMFGSPIDPRTYDYVNGRFG
jgi:phosphate ABC transporter ATP-binding protein